MAMAEKHHKLMSAVQLTVGLLLCITLAQCSLTAQKIDRKALVHRHSVHVQAIDSLASLTVGNGRFAFTVDATGLQSFPEAYSNGVPLGTQAEWGWHAFPNKEGYRFEETLRNYNIHGRQVSYGVQWKEPERNRAASDFFRQNPHRLQLGNIGFAITLANGRPAGVEHIENIEQELDLYAGIISSRFRVEGVPVQVHTVVHPHSDVVAVQVETDLVQQGRIAIQLRFPYPTGAWDDAGTYYGSNDKHSSTWVPAGTRGGSIRRQLDATQYSVFTRWQQAGTVTQAGPHHFVLQPAKGKVFSATIGFASDTAQVPMDFSEVRAAAAQAMEAFWQSGGAIDFEGSTDERAAELERRVVLSQYLTRVQCAGSYPPQETGLTANSWYGKPHLEMHWWHGVHFLLWGRPQLLEPSLAWYSTVMQPAQRLAQRQGYAGARWQKMVDHSGHEAPSSVGAFILWQQPHPITFAELLYRQQPGEAVLKKYYNLVMETATFMASYAWYDTASGRYMLGPGLIPAQERFAAADTYNPAYELHYWHWALQTAQAWRTRMGLERKSGWDSVLQRLAPLPVQGGVYLAAESAPDSYTNPRYLTDHPSVLGALGMLPASAMLDTAIMRATLDTVWRAWTWDHTWGWDFPMTAMTAARLGQPERAIDALLMPVRTNTYLVNGHNYQDKRLRLYLPGNGGVLAAVALMVAGYDGCREPMPGIPKNGKWKVKWEGLHPML